MRWVVELPAESGGTGATVTADGESWKAALGVARAGKPLSKFRCDFDEDGTVRVWDMTSNERFVVRPLSPKPAEPQPARPISMAPSSGPGTATAPAVAPAPSTPPSPAPAVAPAPAVPPGSAAVAPVPAVAPATPVSAVAEPSPLAVVPPSTSILPGAPPDESVPPPAAMLFAQNRDPSVATPLTYRERLLTVPQGTAAGVAERVAREMLTTVRGRMAGAPAGQFVSIAVFDHAFRSKPERPPMVVLSWKDWRGDRAEVQYPATPARVESPSTDLPPVTPIAAVSSGAATAAQSALAAAPIVSGPTVAIPSAAAAPPPVAASERPKPMVVATPAVAQTSAPVVAAAPVKAPVEPAPAVSVVAPTPAVVAPQVPATAAVVTPPAPSSAAAPSPAVSPNPPALEAVAPATAPTTPSVVVAPVPPSPPVAPAIAPVAPIVAVATPVAAPKPAAPVATPAAPVAPAAKPTGPRRGEDLLTEAFEATQDLVFLADTHEASEFVVQLIVNLLHAAGVAVMVYDIDRDELVLESTSGVQGVAGTRVALAQGPRGESAIRNKLVLLSEPYGEDSLVSATPMGPVLFAPIRHDNRLFGVLQIHRAANEDPFGNDEQHTVSYVAGQLGKFLADHSKRVGFKEEDHPRGR